LVNIGNLINIKMVKKTSILL